MEIKSFLMKVKRETIVILIQVFLFILTFVTTTLSGTEWVYARSVFDSDPYTWIDFLHGMRFSVPFLLILTVHEFGHYFTAMWHRIRTSLPYYIPIPPIALSIGTLGAIIRIRDRVYSNIQHFDIGLAGPLAGFIIALGILFYGFRTLPPPDYIYQFHPEYKAYGDNYKDYVYSETYLKEHPNEIDLVFGTNLLFMFFEKFVADPGRVPNPHEMMHYPVLMAGFIALFFTSLNLLPIGQLDGGHVIYGLFGRNGHRIIATVSFLALLIYSGLGYASVTDDMDKLSWLIPTGILFYFLCLGGLKLPMRQTLMYALSIVAFLVLMSWLFPHLKGFSGWLFFALLVGRLLGVRHPPSEVEMPLTRGRKILGWICLFIFIVSFSPVPISITEMGISP
jgi:membrane-associated protease RseP (regulator of RpoE activity)